MADKPKTLAEAKRKLATLETRRRLVERHAALIDAIDQNTERVRKAFDGAREAVARAVQASASVPLLDLPDFADPRAVEADHIEMEAGNKELADLTGVLERAVRRLTNVRKTFGLRKRTNKVHSHRLEAALKDSTGLRNRLDDPTVNLKLKMSLAKLEMMSGLLEREFKELDAIMEDVALVLKTVRSGKRRK